MSLSAFLSVAHGILLLLLLTPVDGFVKPYDDGCHWLYDLVDSQTLAQERNLNPIKPFVNVTQHLNMSIKVDFLNDRHNVQNEVRDSTDASFTGGPTQWLSDLNWLHFQTFETYPYFLKVDLRCAGRVRNRQSARTCRAHSATD